MAKEKKAGAIYMILIALFLIFVGSVFFGLMWRSYSRAAQMDSWKQVPAIVELCEVKTRQANATMSKEYCFYIEYNYEYGEKRHQSSSYSLRGTRWSHDEKKITKLVQEFEKGQQIQVYIDPKDPERSVVKKDSKGPLYSIWFPGLFMIGGLGVLFSSFRALFSREKS